jgi:DNA-binding SARP family transcriptional activator
MLSVKLFGSGQAQIGDNSLNGFPNQYACLLLCYLLLNKPHPQNREKLANQFWSGLPHQTARKYLRNALWRLRLSFQNAGEPLEKYIFISEDSISFINKADTWLDIDIFDQTVNQVLKAPDEGIGKEQIRALEDAANLYVGDLLESCYDDWCLYDRERFRLLYTHAMHKIMVYHTRCQQYPLALTTGERLLSLDNTQEKVHRQMMWLYWLQGDRSAAIAQYKKCFEILREELGIRPMRDTRFLYEQILSGQTPPLARTDLVSPEVEESQHQLQLRSQTGNHNSSLYAHTLQRLHKLQEKIEETHAEIQQLERLINEAMVHPGRS